MNHVLKTYPDGSEFTVKYMLVAYGIGAIIGAGLIATQAACEKHSMKRTMKKYGWPKNAIDRV